MMTTMNMPTRNPAAAPHEAEGFTLIELLVTMVVALTLLAGLYSNFFMQSRVEASQSSTVDALEDLRLTSQIMTAQLRLARNICWDSTNNRLVYQPLASTVTLTSTNCGTVDNSWGYFKFNGGTTATGGTLCWDQPASGGSCQEVIRGLDQTSGFSVSPTSNTNVAGLRTLTLISRYQNAQRQNKPLKIEFDALPRNN